jgi:hypothetical protein
MPQKRQMTKNGGSKKKAVSTDEETPKSSTRRRKKVEKVQISVRVSKEWMDEFYLWIEQRGYHITEMMEVAMARLAVADGVAPPVIRDLRFLVGEMAPASARNLLLCYSYLEADLTQSLPVDQMHRQHMLEHFAAWANDPRHRQSMVSIRNRLVHGRASENIELLAEAALSAPSGKHPELTE